VFVVGCLLGLTPGCRREVQHCISRTAKDLTQMLLGMHSEQLTCYMSNLRIMILISSSCKTARTTAMWLGTNYIATGYTGKRVHCSYSAYYSSCWLPVQQGSAMA
jgi:hypothetical protein